MLKTISIILNMTQRELSNVLIKNLYKAEQFKYLKTKHSFHLVDPSPWPIVASLGALMLTTGGVLYMHKICGGAQMALTGFLTILYVMYTWWRDIVREATYEEQHTFSVQRGLRLGMLLFIVSEIMFFFAFFWAFFHSSLAPTFNVGGVWPPAAIQPIATSGIPLTNTFFLLSSGATVTWAHHAIIVRAKKHALISLLLTLILAIIFTGLQGLEYYESSFSISDSIYGSCFFMATGFHGFHVFVGTIALLVSFIRIILNHFTSKHHFGFESAAWYWHFVDVVWLFLFITIYWWNGSTNIPSASFGGFSKLTIVNDVCTFLLVKGGFLFFWLSEFSFIVSTLLLFMLLYLTTYKNDLFYKKFFEFYAPMPYINKLALFSFSVSLAIPVRIWIKTTLPKTLTSIISFILIYLATIFPLVAIFVFYQVVLLLSSLIFVFSYENFPSFKNFICKILFAGNETFASLYFDFFWGNMHSGTFRRAAEMVAGGVATYLAREAREKAVQEAEKKGIERAERAIKQSSEPVTFQEAYNCERKFVKEARSEDPILHTEDTIKEKASELSSWFFGS